MAGAAKIVDMRTDERCRRRIERANCTAQGIKNPNVEMLACCLRKLTISCVVNERRESLGFSHLIAGSNGLLEPSLVHTGDRNSDAYDFVTLLCRLCRS